MECHHSLLPHRYILVLPKEIQLHARFSAMLRLFKSFRKATGIERIFIELPGISRPFSGRSSSGQRYFSRLKGMGRGKGGGVIRQFEATVDGRLTAVHVIVLATQATAAFAVLAFMKQHLWERFGLEALLLAQCLSVAASDFVFYRVSKEMREHLSALSIKDFDNGQDSDVLNVHGFCESAHSGRFSNMISFLPAKTAGQRLRTIICLIFNSRGIPIDRLQHAKQLVFKFLGGFMHVHATTFTEIGRHLEPARSCSLGFGWQAVGFVMSLCFETGLATLPPRSCLAQLSKRLKMHVCFSFDNVGGSLTFVAENSAFVFAAVASLKALRSGSYPEIAAFKEAEWWRIPDGHPRWNPPSSWPPDLAFGPCAPPGKFHEFAEVLLNEALTQGCYLRTNMKNPHPNASNCHFCQADEGFCFDLAQRVALEHGVVVWHSCYEHIGFNLLVAGKPANVSTFLRKVHGRFIARAITLALGVDVVSPIA